MELIFLQQQVDMLCFGFVTKTALATDECFGHGSAVLARCQGFLFLSFSHSALLSKLAEGNQAAGSGTKLTKGVFQSI